MEAFSYFKQKSRTASTSLQPISTAMALLHSEPSCSSNTEAAQACSRQTPLLQQNIPCFLPALPGALLDAKSTGRAQGCYSAQARQASSPLSTPLIPCLGCIGGFLPIPSCRPLKHLLQEPHPPTAQAEGRTLPAQPLLSKALHQRGSGTAGRRQASARTSPHPRGTRPCSHSKLLSCCNTTHPQPKHQRHTSAL